MITLDLYGYAASREERRAVPDIRKGEYEGLKDKLLDPEWMPDYGIDFEYFLD